MSKLNWLILNWSVIGTISINFRQFDLSYELNFALPIEVLGFTEEKK